MSLMASEPHAPQQHTMKPNADVPWSCCDPKIFRPCSHTNIKINPSHPAADLTIYQVFEGV